MRGGEFTLKRAFDAPKETVYRMWTEPEHFARWYGPQMFDIPLCEMDARVGGAIKVDMKAPGPDGPINSQGGEFVELSPHDRVVFTLNAMPGPDGEHMFQTLNTITLEESAGGGTDMAMRVQVTRTTPEMGQLPEGMDVGWMQAFEKMESHMAEIS